MEEVVLGIDLGTSAIKIIAVNHQGEVLDTVSEPLELFQDQPGYSEQNPDDWYESTKRGIQRITSSQMLKNKIVKGLFRTNAWLNHIGQTRQAVTKSNPVE